MRKGKRNDTAKITKRRRAAFFLWNKKVLIDEIATAAGIAKGFFYSFCPSNEHFYMEIAGNLQVKIWREMDAFLRVNRSFGEPLYHSRPSPVCFFITLSRSYRIWNRSSTFGTFPGDRIVAFGCRFNEYDKQ